MTRRAKRWAAVILGVLLLFVGATVLKHYLNSIRFPRKPPDPPNSPASRTAADAKERGLWVCDVALLC
jgi:hypothetical protein